MKLTQAQPHITLHTPPHLAIKKQYNSVTQWCQEATWGHYRVFHRVLCCFLRGSRTSMFLFLSCLSAAPHELCVGWTHGSACEPSWYCYLVIPLTITAVSIKAVYNQICTCSYSVRMSYKQTINCSTCTYMYTHMYVLTIIVHMNIIL